MGGGVASTEGELGVEGGGLQGLFFFQPSPFQTGSVPGVVGVVGAPSR